MSSRFYHEDGQGKVVDELGNDAMDWDDTMQKWRKCQRQSNSRSRRATTNIQTNLNIKKSTVHNFLKTECNLSLNRVTIRPVSRDDTTKIAARLDWVKHWTMTDMNYLRNCVLVGESAFNINM
ncbi:hypothetical protein HMPREF1544_10529 [Mucor circinelloides 1006PhL]|uniref:Uncharacterized protein n=1 Tax=Mucor circinelloides f. circinelloides (strain 1006PhL) TaxID=1220926 RepID=S2IY86_MUCC1|nr:hypothetical protein HMPREF1544_10529 [Mucor circinelloides 1006PhL]